MIGFAVGNMLAASKTISASKSNWERMENLIRKGEEVFDNIALLL